MNYKVRLGVIHILLLLLAFNIQGQEIEYQKTESFYPGLSKSEQKNIDCGVLTVPENWEIPNGNEVQIAVSVLKNTSNLENGNPVVFIQGGPGANTLNTVRLWLDHPLNEKNDIVLFDIRGLGLSAPKLCPELGKEFMEILAKDQTEEQDEKDKAAAAMLCKQRLLNRGIDVTAYNSLSVAKDLHALKTKLGYEKWNVYGASYGTYMTQVYASVFPEDIKSLVLDSSISDISTFYARNAENFIGSLTKVFEQCKNDPDCNKEYPDLEKVFFQTIADLEENPVTVAVDKSILETGTFTYNAEDFKVSIQQALYHKQLVEVLPLLIYQFHNKNQDALGNLVSAFSSLLGMDYGLYYCVSCNEVLPNNNISDFHSNAAQFNELDGGISFYKSDFDVCSKWNEKRDDSTYLYHDLSNLATLDVPVLVFAGEFDPITPATNGKAVADVFSNAYLIDAQTYGHVPSFSEIGNEVTVTFVNKPSPEIKKAFEETSQISFAKDIKLNKGVSSMGNSLIETHPIFLTPLFIAFLLMAVFLIIHLVKLIRGSYGLFPDKIVRGISMLTSIVGIVCLAGFVVALTQVADSNYFVLAFGLPEDYSYLFWVLLVFVVLAIITLVFFGIYIKKIKDRSIVFSVIFSHIVLVTYFIYWGVL